MPSSFVSLILIFSISSCILCDIYASPFPCKECATEEECNRPPNDYCVWGEHKDFCGRRVCSKGPGERCGGPRNILGLCGEGMMCKSDEFSHGCSTQTMQCYTL